MLFFPREYSQTAYTYVFKPIFWVPPLLKEKQIPGGAHASNLPQNPVIGILSLVVMSSTNIPSDSRSKYNMTRCFYRGNETKNRTKKEIHSSQLNEGEQKNSDFKT
jgi:hypothetical protein